MKNKLLLFITSLIMVFSGVSNAVEAKWPVKTTYKFATVQGKKIFYREAGERNRPTIVLLHGYPASSHSYRELIPLLSGYYHIIAPDNLGSGYSDKPDTQDLTYTFDLLASYTQGLLEELQIDRYTLYMQDFGAPVGFRLMVKQANKIEAVIAQNANAYLEGIPLEKQKFFVNAQLDKSAENQKRLFDFTSEEAIKHKQYLRDVKGREEIMSPDSWTHDAHMLEKDANRNIQVQLFQDYKTNLDAYAEWQAFMKKQQYPMLLVWGKNDPVFTEAGARAYLKDNPDAELHLIDAGHFAVEEAPVETAKHILNFMNSLEH